jgi:hypothetical protein
MDKPCTHPTAEITTPVACIIIQPGTVSDLTQVTSVVNVRKGLSNLIMCPQFHEHHIECNQQFNFALIRPPPPPKNNVSFILPTMFICG